MSKIKARENKIQAYMFLGPVQKWANTIALYYKPKRIHIWLIKVFFGFSIISAEEYDWLNRNEWFLRRKDYEQESKGGNLESLSE